MVISIKFYNFFFNCSQLLPSNSVKSNLYSFSILYPSFHYPCPTNKPNLSLHSFNLKLVTTVLFTKVGKITKSETDLTHPTWSTCMPYWPCKWICSLSSPLLCNIRGQIWMSILNVTSQEFKDLRLKVQAYLRGFAKMRCPIVTKLVSWLDMNQASEETLPNK